MSTSPGIGIHRREWEELAKLDPLFAILTEKGKQFGKWDREEFFASGRKEINELMQACGFQGANNGRALDFGCGVGRLSRALRSYFDEVCGVDISEQMVGLARQFTPSCKFVVNQSFNLNGFDNDSFDFLYSNIVLQHQPTKEIARGYIREFIRILKPTGIAVFQIPYKLTLRYALQPKRRLYSLLRNCGLPADLVYNRLHLNPIRTICLSTDDVTATVVNAAGRVVRSHPDNFNHNSRSYVVAKSREPKS
jgi:ubiquinone/menaquinone biosynthesis C-methylase UbiE